MNLKTLGLALGAAFIMSAVSVSAQSPVINKVSDRQYDGYISKLSDNGAWGVGYGKSVIDDIGNSFPRLYNVKTNESTRLFTEAEANSVGVMTAVDVTDDGSIVVGSFNGKPAYWTAADKKWTTFPGLTVLYTMGEAQHITPDGKYVLGTITNGGTKETIKLWEFTADGVKDITPDNLPEPASSKTGLVVDPEYTSYYQRRACDLSPDGKKFIGLCCYSFMGETWTFVYDMNTKSWDGIGVELTKINDNQYNFKRTGTGYITIDDGTFQHGTNKIVGAAWSDNDMVAIYTYDMDTKAIAMVPDSDGKEFGAVDAEGSIFASESVMGPVRNWFVRIGNYWYDFKVLAKQVWGIDWMSDITKDEYGYSGTLTSTSTNGLTAVASDFSETPYISFVMQFPETLGAVAPRVNLLDNYYVTPVNNSAFAMLREVKVTFDRDIEVCGDPSSVMLKDEDGNVVAKSIGMTLEAGNTKVLSVTFRNRRLDVGKTYTVVVPANSVNIVGDKDRKNSEITVSYKGRPNAPVAVTKVSPADGMEISRINATSNPVVFTFDSELAAVENGGKMLLYLIDEDNARQEISVLNGSITGNTLSVYPAMEQRLAKGSEYELVIQANTVSDLSGADPNQEIVVKYTGSYVPEQTNLAQIFFDDFNTGINTNNWMTYDADNGTPTEEYAQMGFAPGVAWWVGRDNVGISEMFAMSHSSYDPVGASEDWLVTNQLYIKDDSAVLSFLSQSYRKNTEDKLKVYVYPSDDVYTALTENIVKKIQLEGDKIYDEVESPGEIEATTAGEWKENHIKLDKYAGKNIYIAFLNDNRNKSAIFIDNVEVKRDVKFGYTNLTPVSVLNKEDVTVKGILSVQSETDTYKGYKLTLKDAQGNTVSTVEDAAAEMAKGWEQEITFPQALPLTVGKEVKYSIEVNIGELTETIESSVKDLAVNTERKVVLEKYTGTTCPNCPAGIVALEHIEKDFPGKVIPLELHTYAGDQYSTPFAVNLTSFLGLNAAPTAHINRLGISNPLSEDSNGKYINKNDGLWYDFVASELAELSPADITITNASFANDVYELDVEVKYALDMDNQNVNILTVITEDGLTGVQENNRGNIDDPMLGEWGKDGMYSAYNVPWTYNDVVRLGEGTTANGTGGYIPASVKAGQAYTAKIQVKNNKRFVLDNKNTKATVMLIDAETGYVLNANRTDNIDFSAVENINADNAGVSVNVVAGEISVLTNEYADVVVYAVDGRAIAAAAGAGELQLRAEGYTGVAMVVVKTAEGVKTFKIML